jgi:hypothetical protein
LLLRIQFVLLRSSKRPRVSLRSPAINCPAATGARQCHPSRNIETADRQENGSRSCRSRECLPGGGVEDQGTTMRRGCANFRFRSVSSVHSFWTMPGFGPGMSTFLQNLSVNASVPWFKVGGVLNSFRDRSASA